MTTTDREIEPNNIEYQIFALAFTEPGAIDFFAENLPVSAVGYGGKVGLNQFYQTMLDFHSKIGLNIVDPVAFKSWLETETDIMTALGGAEMVSIFIETVLSIEKSTPETVTNIVKFKANKRAQLDSVQELQQLLAKKGKVAAGMQQKITDLTDRIRNLENDLGYDPLSKVTTAADIAANLDIEKLWEIPEFLSTQFIDLNKALGYTESGGFFRGAVHAIIAQSGKGKSTFAKTLMNNWLDNGYTCLYINYEEPQKLWEMTLFTQITKRNLFMGASSEEEKHALTKTYIDKLNSWGDRMLVRHDLDTPFFEDLELWMRDLICHEEHSPDVVIIDTIQSMFTKGSNGGPRWGQFEEMMVRLEKLAKDLDAVFIITAQENSNRMKENREVVKQSDTGGSLSIQQKCAVTIFITEKKKQDETADSSIMELQIPKNRITGTVFNLKPALVKYNDNIKAYEPYDYVQESDYSSSLEQDYEECFGEY